MTNAGINEKVISCNVLILSDMDAGQMVGNKISGALFRSGGSLYAANQHGIATVIGP